MEIPLSGEFNTTMSKVYLRSPKKLSQSDSAILVASLSVSLEALI